MATRRLGISRGEEKWAITEAAGAAVSSDNVELTWDLATGLSKDELLNLVEKLKQHILQINYPPA